MVAWPSAICRISLRSDSVITPKWRLSSSISSEFITCLYILFAWEMQREVLQVVRKGLVYSTHPASLFSSAAHSKLCRDGGRSVSYTHLRAHETPEHLVCRLLLEKKKT